MAPTPLDPLESLLHLEHNFYTEGLRHRPPTQTAPQTAHSLGFSSSHPLTTQLEFYRGTATTLLALDSTFPNTLPPKSITAAQKLLAASIPPLSTLGNTPSIDFQTHTTTLRNLFIQMIAFARIPRLRFALPSTNNPASTPSQTTPHHLDF